MADAFLKVVFENLNSLIRREIGSLWGVNKEMEKLSSTLSTIQAVLEDAEQKRLQDKAIQNWLRKLKHAAYAVDDILDECATEAGIRLQSEGQNSGLLGKVHSSFLPYTPKNIQFSHKIGKKMKEITEKLDAIAKEKNNFHLSVVAAPQRVEAVERLQTSSTLTQPQVYGREEDKEKIVEQLVERASDCQHVSVYPITGMGGLGKTTLAQLVFNEERITRHFQPRIWVCVSEDFDVRRVIKAIIESASGEACEDLDRDPLEKRLKDILNGKNFLLILDDVWNEDEEKWDMVKSVLACGSKSASIITTTRLETVASIMGTLPAHRLSGLSEDDCWSLFKQRAFGNETEDHPNLVAIGKEIVNKCGGVPLAAKALGGLLRFKRGESEWLSIKESEIWNLPQDENSILPALRLSYYNLSLELRRCFAYCAVFEKDSKIEKDNLIHLWMAHGFISSNKKLELEDAGNEVWNELYWRSFFQDVEQNKFDNSISFKMHDLVHDLAQSVMEDECLVMEVERSGNISNREIRHITLVANSRPYPAIPKALQKVESLRTFLLQYRQPNTIVSTLSSRIVSELPGEFTKLGALRVLDARLSNIWKLSSSIGNLKHLRYLNLYETDIRALPKSICSLWNLQILNLQYCWKLQRLPKHLRRLRSLRHLYLKGCPLIHMPPKIGQLTCLKTLSLFIVGKRKGCHLGELQSLNLRGELCIKNLERVGNQMDAKEANLEGKENLRDLRLRWGSNSESELQENVEQLLEALQPHPNIENLDILGYKGKQFPLWMSDLVLKNLVRIGLSDCKNCLQLPLLGQLPSLQCLWISGMNFVEYIDSHFHGGAAVRGGFRSLETLGITELPNLKGLSRDEGAELFPCLREMTISKCPKLTLPCLSSLEELTIWGCNNVILSSISNLSSLTSLKIFDSEEDVISFPEPMLQNLPVLQSLHIERLGKLKVLPTSLANLTALKTLGIRECQEVESLPEQGLRGLHSLQRLHIEHCNKLSSLSEGLRHLTALERLNVDGCPEMVALPEGIKHLYSLQHLSISGHPPSPENPILCPKLTVFPEALQHVPALESLTIWGYPELTSLPDWLGSLTSLQSLRIWDCPKPASVPASIGSLTKLQTLEIRRCSDELARRCEKGSGEDWYKIAHIPQVSIF